MHLRRVRLERFAELPIPLLIERPPSLLNLDHFSRQTAGDRHLQRELLMLFKEHSPDLIAELRLASGGASATVGPAALAHRLKGSALAIGAFPLAAAAKAMERALAENAGGEAALVVLVDALAQTIAEIDIELEKLDAELRA